MSDQDLESLISQFQKIQPTDQQMNSWQIAILDRFRRPKYYLAAGLAAGIVIGILLAQFLPTYSAAEENFSATISRYTVNNL